MQIISNISLALLSWLTHLAVFWHLSVAKQYVDQRREHGKGERSLENCTGVSGEQISVHPRLSFSLQSSYTEATKDTSGEVSFPIHPK